MIYDYVKFRKKKLNFYFIIYFIQNLKYVNNFTIVNNSNGFELSLNLYYII